MTTKEAIDRLRKRICCEMPIQHYCTDDCLYGSDVCEISMAIDALENRMPIEPFLGFLQSQLKLNHVSEDAPIYSYKNIEEIVLALMGSDFATYYRSTKNGGTYEHKREL